MYFADSEDACMEPQADGLNPRKRIIIETKKTTTTTTTTRKELYVDGSDISMSDIEALLKQDATPAIEDVVDVNEEIITDVRKKDDDAEPLFSSTKLNVLHQSSERITPTDEYDAIECENDKSPIHVPDKSSGRSAKKGAKTRSSSSKKSDSRKSDSKKSDSRKSDSSKLDSKKSDSRKSKHSDNKSAKKPTRKQSNAPEIKKLNARYPSRDNRTSPTTNMAKIATKKEPKRKSAIDEMINTYASMVRAHHTSVAEQPQTNEAPPPPPPPQTASLVNHELSAIIENPDESMESRAYEEEGPLRTAELERSYPDELVDNVEHLLDTYNVEVPSKLDLSELTGDGKSSKKSKTRSIDNVSKSTKSGRVSKPSRKPTGKENGKLKKAVAELSPDTIKPTKKTSSLKAIVGEKSKHGNSRADSKHADDSSGKSDKKDKRDSRSNKIADGKRSSPPKVIVGEKTKHGNSKADSKYTDDYGRSGKKDRKDKNVLKSNKIDKKSPTKTTKNVIPADEIPPPMFMESDDPFDAIAHTEDEDTRNRKSNTRSSKHGRRSDKSPKASLRVSKHDSFVDTIDPFDALKTEKLPINKRKSDPKKAKDVKADKKSKTISKKSIDGGVSKAPKKTKRSVEKTSSPPPTRKDPRLHALDHKSIKIYSPSCRNKFKTIHGNHVKISKETIEKAIVKNCSSSRDLLKRFHAHDVEIEDDKRLYILPGQKARPISKEEAENMDPMAVGRMQYCAQTLLVRDK